MALGRSAIAFTEHGDHTVWTVDLDAIVANDHLLSFTSTDGPVTPSAFDAHGYLRAIRRCRDRFLDLRILNGLELGEPHLHPVAVAQVLDGDGFAEPGDIFGHRAAADVIYEYLEDVARMVFSDDTFSVLALGRRRAIRPRELRG